MAITAAMVKELRELTGAGMMDCKKALGETDGDMDKAVDYLRENGLAKAAKKAGRIAAEGLVKCVVSDDTKAAIVEVNSETDFVAKNADFAAYVEEVANQALTSDAADMDAFMAEAWKLEPEKTVADALAFGHNGCYIIDFCKFFHFTQHFFKSTERAANGKTKTFFIGHRNFPPFPKEY